MLTTIEQLFRYYEQLGRLAIEQCTTEDIQFRGDDESLPIATIAQHIIGNMRSRFTNFYTEDGEKPWRQREQEFDTNNWSQADCLREWRDGWQLLFELLEGMKDSDLERIVYIRNQGHTVYQALLRQATHYAYHVGQIVFIAKGRKGANWQSLSIAKGESEQFRQAMMAKEKSITFFTEK